MIIYILINLGVLFTIFGSILYSPAMIPDTTGITIEEARNELINETKGAFIAQDYEVQQYNMGFDMLNFGGIFLLLGSLVFNYIIAPKRQKAHLDPTSETYALRKNGILKGNIIEWTCMILFLFAFFQHITSKVKHTKSCLI